jgi:hypothetical protein
MPKWMRLQLGTLDCEYSKKLYGSKFDLCVLNDPLPCSSVVNLLSERFVPAEHIAMLQIDIEGYEYILLEGIVKEIPDKSLPPVIHFEKKVMIDQDSKFPINRTSRMARVEQLLGSKGYVLYDEGADCLALRFGLEYAKQVKAKEEMYYKEELPEKENFKNN